MNLELPDPERLVELLIERMRPALGPNAALVGIHTGGVWVAERLVKALGVTTPMGQLDVSFYRDDFDKVGLHRNVRRTDIPFDAGGRHIVLVDDVLYTGRTIRAALNEIFDYGRPASVRLAALIDRGGRELPIAADWTGAVVPVAAPASIELTRDETGRLGLSLHEG